MEDIQAFCSVSGDTNPIHLDEGFASRSQFGRIIVPGMLIGGYFSAILANEMPGPGTIYMHQSMDFLSPLYVDEEFIVREKILDVIGKKGDALLSTECLTLAESRLVVLGYARVRQPAWANQ